MRSFFGILAVFMLMALRTTYQYAKIALLLGDELCIPRPTLAPVSACLGGSPASDYCDAHGENSFGRASPQRGGSPAPPEASGPASARRALWPGLPLPLPVLYLWCLIAGMLLSFVLEVGVHAHWDHPRAWVWVVPAIYAVPIAIALIVMVDRRSTHPQKRSLHPARTSSTSLIWIIATNCRASRGPCILKVSSCE